MRAVELPGTEPLHAVALPPADAWLYCLVGLLGWTDREGTRRHSQVALVGGAFPPHRHFIRLAARLAATIELCLRAQTKALRVAFGDSFFVRRAAGLNARAWLPCAPEMSRQRPRVFRSAY